MNLLHAILLVGVVATNGAKATNGTTTTVLPTVAPTSWAGSMIAWWSMDQTNPTNDAGTGTCGGTASNCDLTANGNYAASSTTYIQGTGAGSMDGTGDYATCAGGTCTALNRSSSTTWGCFAYQTGSGAGQMGRSWTSLRDYRLYYNSSETICSEASAATNSTATSSSVSHSTSPLSQWMSNICVYNSIGLTLTAYTDGVAGTPTGSAAAMAASTNTFYIGNTFRTLSSDSNFSGYLDDCFVYGGVMSATSVCRICSCGVDGSLCACDRSDNTVYASAGRNSSCGFCALPSCNAASP